ncbi:MAG: hypothetical protein AB8B47_14245 [Roseobacter sp.]
MEPHPDFIHVDLPREFAIGAYHLAPLSPEFVKEDYDAVMASAPLLHDIFGDWPTGLTVEDNAIDLAWHEREFTSRRSFSWILRNETAVYIGCFYVYPAIGARDQAKATLWLCDIAQRDTVARTLRQLLGTWLEANIPTNITITWATSPRLEA